MLKLTQRLTPMLLQMLVLKLTQMLNPTLNLKPKLTQIVKQELHYYLDTIPITWFTRDKFYRILVNCLLHQVFHLLTSLYSLLLTSPCTLMNMDTST